MSQRAENLDDIEIDKDDNEMNDDDVEMESRGSRLGQSCLALNNSLSPSLLDEKLSLATQINEEKNDNNREINLLDSSAYHVSFHPCVSVLILNLIKFISLSFAFAFIFLFLYL